MRTQGGPVSEFETTIQFREGLLWAEVRTSKEKHPLNFLLDSGAGVSVLNLRTARRLGLQLGAATKVTGVAKSVTGYWPVSMQAHLEDLELPSKYLAIDLAKLSNACGCSVDGLLGADFFRGRTVQIDFVHQKLRLLKETLPDGLTNVIPLKSSPEGFSVSLRVNGGPSQNVRLDTGCASAFQWVTNKRTFGRCPKSLSVGLDELVVPQVMTGIRLGNQNLDMVPTGLHRKCFFPGEFGLLGNGILAQFGTITVDTISGYLLLGQAIPPQPSAPLNARDGD